AADHRHPVQPPAGSGRVLSPLPAQPPARPLQAARAGAALVQGQERSDAPGPREMTHDTGAHNIGSPILWASFLAGVLILLAIDLRIAGKRDAPSGFREAMWWSIFWIILSLAFGG